VLLAIIRREIAANGRITFRRYMELALYEPTEGYYRTRPAAGTRGDYLTSPEIHPLYGAVLCRQLAEFWQLLGSPIPFRLIEMGAGNGTLARAILSSSPAELRAALQYVIVEPDELSQQRQLSSLGALADSVDWVPSLARLAPAAACLISNELVDAFPVHRVAVRQGRLQEIFVGDDGHTLREIVDEPSTAAIHDYFDRLELYPGESSTAEVNLDALSWILDVSNVIDRGFVLTIDYGYPARQLYAAWRKQGTLLTFYQHTSGTDPYTRVGRQDITAHIDFTSLAQAGRNVALEPLGFSSQQQFLVALGVQEALAGGPSAAASLEEYLARRRAVEALLDPQGLGRLRVLAQGKAVGRPALRGFPAGGIEALK
jgi:SAM-dependent MidA family methyltransferase